jgi:thiamine-phosphate pyrophosphorylase
MLVTQRTLAGSNNVLVEAVAAAVTGGVNAVQLREKDMDTRALRKLAGSLREAIAGRALLLVNGNAAVAADADGLHLPEDADYARPEGVRLVGRSVHSAALAVRAEREGVDYVIAGSIYQSETHPDRAPSDLMLIADTVNAVSMPVVGIGGITADRVQQVMAAGASGIAVVSAILAADSPEEAARELWDALNAPPLEH